MFYSAVPAVPAVSRTSDHVYEMVDVAEDIEQKWQRLEWGV